MSCGCLKPKCNSEDPVVFSCSNDGRDVEFIALEEFLPRVTLVAKGVPDDIALEYLRQSAQIVARDSRLLKREVYIDVQAGVRDYYLESGDYEQIHYIHSIRVGKSCCQSDCCEPIRLCSTDAFNFEPPDKIILRKTPKQDKENQLKVEYFAMPTQSTCQVDKLLFERYHDVIVNGALADLLLMRQYEFSDPQLAMIYERKFKQGIAQVKIDVMQKFDTRVRSIAYTGRI